MFASISWGTGARISIDIIVVIWAEAGGFGPTPAEANKLRPENSIGPKQEASDLIRPKLLGFGPNSIIGRAA